MSLHYDVSTDSTIGTLGEVLPCLRLGRRVLAAEVDTTTHDRGMEVLRNEIRVRCEHIIARPQSHRI